MQGSGGCLSYTPSGGPKLTQRRYHYNGSRYVTVDLLSVRVRVGFRDLTLIFVVDLYVDHK